MIYRTCDLSGSQHHHIWSWGGKQGHCLSSPHLCPPSLLLLQLLCSVEEELSTNRWRLCHLQRLTWQILFLILFKKSFVADKTMEEIQQHSSCVNENQNINPEVVNNNCLKQDCISLLSGIFLLNSVNFLQKKKLFLEKN